MTQKAPKKSKNPVFTAANIVTIVRIVLVPIFFLILMAPWPNWFPYWSSASVFKPWLAAIVFGVLSATDGVDGYLARSRNEVTTLGKFLDPIADKILVCAALLALIELGKLPSWIALIIVAREFIVSGLRMVASSQGMVIAASWYGKWKTALTLVALLLFIVKDSHAIVSLGYPLYNIFQITSWTVMGIAVILTIVSMIDYFAKANAVLHLFSSPTLETVPRSASESASENATASPSGSIASASPSGSISAADVLEMARGKGLSLSTAESCTGGLVAGALTEVPGSSEVFMGGVVSYSNAAKHNILEVSQEDLDTHGAVSHEVAEQMALGSSKRYGTDVAVSTTGVAGPGGGSKEKPVGTVWFGLAVRGVARSELHHFKGSRSQVREQSVETALRLLSEGMESIED